MNGRAVDIAIVGGGLSGGLIALALRRARPELEVALIEAGETLGGNHRWSWFASDLSSEGEALLAPFRKAQWDGGYEVRFPELQRHLSTPYCSMASSDFDAALRRELGEGQVRLHAPVASLDAGGVNLDNGDRIAARTVIDCRGHTPSPALRGGWQVFMGRHMRTNAPHGLSHPLVMDAAVEQPGAYRFVYVLPLGAHELFVEDTYYADSPLLDRRALSSRIDAYCAQHGWEGDLLGHEAGVLPVVTGGSFTAFQAAGRIAGVAVAGARGGFSHPLTSYTLPQAVALALTVAKEANLPGDQLAALLEREARRLWASNWFYRKLGAMLFGAGEANRRYRIFQHFHRLPEGLIERFYAAHSTPADRLRILWGKPPVPVLGAIRSLLASGASLAEGGPV